MMIMTVVPYNTLSTDCTVRLFYFMIYFKLVVALFLSPVTDLAIVGKLAHWHNLICSIRERTKHWFPCKQYLSDQNNDYYCNLFGLL